MEKLILHFTQSDGCTYSCETTIPIEWSSKIELQLHILELVQNHKISLRDKYTEEEIEKYYRNGSIKILEQDFSVEDVENAEHIVYTLEEWFEQYKLK